MKTITHIGQTMLFGDPNDEDSERGMVLDVQGNEVTIAWEQGAETTQTAEWLGVALAPVIGTEMHCRGAYATLRRTADGLVIYNLDPSAGKVFAIAGPAGIDPRFIDAHNLPDCCRWITDDEWEAGYEWENAQE